MKNLKLLTLLWIIAISWFLSWCWNNWNNSNKNIENITTKANEAAEYNNSLISIASKCPTTANTVRDLYENNSQIGDIKTATENTLLECKNAINQINTIWDLEWDSSLKNEIITTLNLYTAYFTKFNEMLTYIEKENLTKEESESYKKIVQEIKNMDKEMDYQNNNLFNIQSEFAQNHWFELEDIE